MSSAKSRLLKWTTMDRLTVRRAEGRVIGKVATRSPVRELFNAVRRAGGRVIGKVATVQVDDNGSADGEAGRRQGHRQSRDPPGYS